MELIDDFLQQFRWDDCRFYHNSIDIDKILVKDENRLPIWKDILLKALPLDGEYLVRSTYNDAIHLMSEYIYYKKKGIDYQPTLGISHLQNIFNRVNLPSNSQYSQPKEMNDESYANSPNTPYMILMAQVFLVYLTHFSHQELYRSFLAIFLDPNDIVESMKQTVPRIRIEGEDSSSEQDSGEFEAVSDKAESDYNQQISSKQDKISSSTNFDSLNRTHEIVAQIVKSSSKEKDILNEFYPTEFLALSLYQASKVLAKVIEDAELSSKERSKMNLNFLLEVSLSSVVVKLYASPNRLFTISLAFRLWRAKILS
jgi:hypothetical protein